ncbi:hypothetical protein B0O80DRAFT_72502 [Mortierella sp. GBAus27b]|nr:hypothetical protein B0O80DRAFT_72502 [Mortierella sp. GBAus27b]
MVQGNRLCCSLTCIFMLLIPALSLRSITSASRTAYWDEAPCGHRCRSLFEGPSSPAMLPIGDVERAGPNTDEPLVSCKAWHEEGVDPLQQELRDPRNGGWTVPDLEFLLTRCCY